MMINIKQPPKTDLIDRTELYDYLSVLAAEINRCFAELESRQEEVSAKLTAVEEKVEDLENNE